MAFVWTPEAEQRKRRGTLQPQTTQAAAPNMTSIPQPPQIGFNQAIQYSTAPWATPEQYQRAINYWQNKQNMPGGGFLGNVQRQAAERFLPSAQQQMQGKGQYELQMRDIIASMLPQQSLPQIGYTPSQQWLPWNTQMERMGYLANQSLGQYMQQNPQMFFNPQGGMPSGIAPIAQMPQPPTVGQYNPMGGATPNMGSPTSGFTTVARWYNPMGEATPKNQSEIIRNQMLQQAFMGIEGGSQMPQPPTVGQYNPMGGATPNMGIEGGSRQTSGTPFFDQWLSQPTPSAGLGINQPNVGEAPIAPDFTSAVSGDLQITPSQLGQMSGQEQFNLARQLALTSPELDAETREKLLAPAQKQSEIIRNQMLQQALAHGQNLGFNTGAMENILGGVTQAAAQPLIQAEADLINQGLNRQLQARQAALGGFGEIAAREAQTGLQAGQLGLQQKQLNLEAATQAGNFALGQGQFNLNKGRLALDTQQVEQEGKLTELGMRLDDQFRKAGLELDKYKTDKGYDLERAKFDFQKKLEERGMSLQERMQAADEFYRGLGMSMDAQDREFQRNQIMSEMLQNAAQWDDEMAFKYKGLEIESMLTQRGIDSREAMFAGELITNLLTGRERLDFEKWSLLKQLDAQSGGGLGGILGSLAGGLLGSFTGGIGTAIGAGLGSNIFSGGGV